VRWERGEDLPATWTTLDNAVVDDDLSCRALGLLTRWLRRPPGAEIDSIPDMVKRAKRDGKERLEGRDALYAASYELEEAGYLVRELVSSEGGQHEWVVRIYNRPVEPSRRSNPDDRKRGSKRGPRTKPQVSPITGFQESADQESADPDSAQPDSAQPDSSSKDSQKDSSLSSPTGLPGAGARGAGERETAAPNAEGGRTDAATPSESGSALHAVPEPRPAEPEQPAQRVARVWARQRAALGVVTSPSRVEALAKEADWLLDQGVPVERLEAEASLMAMQPSWFSLVRHMESRPSQASAVAGEQPAATPEQVAALRARVMRGAML
jgi:hypothetical protein